ncbi:MAG: DNA mismatch endonuclease Vsr [Candidatus Margulisiibacteriota bacterium]
MASVRSSRNRSTENALASIFRRLKLRGWRRSYPLYGKPDFVFPEKRVAVFADGCFWHGHNCRNTKPKVNRSFWRNKIARNIARDGTVSSFLRRRGWRIFRIRECNIARGKLPSKFLRMFQSPRCTV